MIDLRFALLGAAAAIGLAGCDDSPIAENAGQGAPPPEVALANDAAASAIRNEAATPSGAANAPIPAALHGRWGLTPGDCDAPPGQAEGLLVVTGDELLFHETEAEVAGNVEATMESIRGEFVFRGEGQTERRFQSLQLEDRRLVRSGNGPAGTTTYVRCPGS